MQNGVNIYIKDSEIAKIDQNKVGQKANLISGIDWKNSEHVSAVNTLLERDASIVTTLMIDKSFIYPLHPDWLEIPALNEAYPLEELQELLTPQAIGRASRMAELIKQEYGIAEISMKEIFYRKVEDIQKLLDLGINVTLGTDTGNSFNFHGYSLHEEMQLLELGGIRPLEILKMSTLNSAKMMKVDEMLGSIEVGKSADMVLLEKNPLESISNSLSIIMVIKNGAVQSRIND